MSKDYYQILGVSRNATDKEITKAYRKIAVQSHPDKQQGKSDEEKRQAEETFKAATEAKNVLLDKEKRKMYDTFGTVDAANFGGGDDIEDFIKRSFGSMHGMGSSFFRQQRVVKGADKRVRLRVSLEEMYNTASHQFTYQRQEVCTECQGSGSADGRTHTCPHCQGRGAITETFRHGMMMGQTTKPCPYCLGRGTVITQRCHKCGGTGLMTVQGQYTLRITPQVVLQGGVSVQGMGNAPQHNDGVNGDLLIAVELQPHDTYSLDENFNLIMEVELPIVDCLLGCKVEVPLIDGKVEQLTIPECAADGARYKLSGKGMRRIDNTFGDLWVTVKHSMPAQMNDEERELLWTLKTKPNFNPC